MDKNRLRVWGAVSLAGSMFLGCSSSKLPGITLDGGDDVPVVPAYVGNWVGYAEATAFVPDGTDVVRLTIGTTSGTLEIGNLAQLPAPTDPNVGYPPASDPPDSSGLWEGFAYPSRAFATDGPRVQLGIDPSDIYAAWCALQTPVQWARIQTTPDGGLQDLYSCVPNWGTGPSGLPDAGVGAGPGCALFPPDGGASVPIDCEKLSACQAQVCACTPTTCSARPVATGTPINQYPANLDVTLEGTYQPLDGTLAMPNGTRLNVHFTKQ